jgi:hypothetical protein
MLGSGIFISATMIVLVEDQLSPTCTLLASARMCKDNTAVGGITLYVEDKGGVITLYLDIYLCRKRNTI